jgi:ATP:ADP antiporter, AAA family
MSYDIINSKEKLTELFNLRKGEERTVIILMVFYFLQAFALALFFVAASAIFLSQYPITSLPYVYLTASGLLIAFEVVYVTLGKSLNRRQLLLTETVILLIFVLLFRIGLFYGQIVWIGFALMAWHRVMGEVVSGGTIRLVLMLFDVRQSKRLFGLASSSEIPANVAGYLLASLLVPTIGTGNLLWISLGSLVISLGFLHYLVQGRQDILVSTDEPEQEIDPRSWFEKLVKSKFIFALCITSFLAMTGLMFIEFSFLSRVDAEVSDQETIVYYLSIILGSGQVLAFFIHTFFYSAIQRRFGIRISLFVVPFFLGFLTLIGISGSFISDNTFFITAIWVIIMVVSDTLKTSLYNNTFMSLLQPLPKKLKLNGFAIVGRFEVVAIGVTGLILILLNALNLSSLFEYSSFLLVVLILWIMSIVVLNKRYIQNLEGVLKKRVLEGGVLHLDDPRTLQLLHEKLDSAFVGESLYALDILCKDNFEKVTELLGTMLSHPVPEVRREVYRRIELMDIVSLQAQVKKCITTESVPELKKLAIHAYCALGEDAVVDEISPYLDAEQDEIQTGALVGLIRFGGINGIIIAGQRLVEYVNSEDPDKRVFAASVIGEVGIHNFYHPLLKLLGDENSEVVMEALKAAGKIKHPRLYSSILKSISSPQVFESAVNALIKTGDEAIETFKNEFEISTYNPTYIRRLAFVCGKVGGEKSIRLLKHKINFKNIEVRNQILHSLMLCNYVASTPEREKVQMAIRQELSDASWLVNCMDAFSHPEREIERNSFPHIINALQIELYHIKKRLLLLLSFIYDSTDILQAYEVLERRKKEKTANAFEILDVLVTKELSSVILPLLEDFPLGQQMKLLNARFPQTKLSVQRYLQLLISEQDTPCLNVWTRAISIFVAKQFEHTHLWPVIEEASASPEKLIADTALWFMNSGRNQFAPVGERPTHTAMPNQNQFETLNLEVEENVLHQNLKAMKAQLMPIEKVMALKTTEIFKETPEDILVEIAYILKEVSYKAGDIIFKKNDNGTCMFVIYDGLVKVHDGDHVLATFSTRDFFGELSLLDAEPRSATVTALQDSMLLRIDQNAFYEIMADRTEVTREIMKILCKRLRSQNAMVAKMNEKVG